MGREPERLVVIGHSHVSCLTAASCEDVRFHVISFWTMPGILDRSSGDLRFSDSAREQLSTPLLSMMGGGAHTELSLAEHPRPFDFVLPGAPDLPLAPGAEILPYEAVRRRLEADASEYLQLTELVRKTVRGPVYHVDAPPPVGDGEFIRPHVPWDYFPGRKQTIADKWHRLRMWRLNTGVAREHAKRIGIGFIAHPREVEDPEGFMGQTFSIDGIHANEAYGQLLARRIVDVVKHGRLGPGDLAPAGAG